MLNRNFDVMCDMCKDVTSRASWVLKQNIKRITYNLISDYTATYRKYKNNRISFNFSISFNRNAMTFAATRHVPWALNTPKCVCKFILSLGKLGKLTTLPQIA